MHGAQKGTAFGPKSCCYVGGRRDEEEEEKKRNGVDLASPLFPMGCSSGSRVLNLSARGMNGGQSELGDRRPLARCVPVSGGKRGRGKRGKSLRVGKPCGGEGKREKRNGAVEGEIFLFGFCIACIFQFLARFRATGPIWREGERLCGHAIWESLLLFVLGPVWIKVNKTKGI